MSEQRKGCWYIVWDEFKHRHHTVSAGEYRVDGATDKEDDFIARSMARTMNEQWGDYHRAEWRPK